MSHKVSTDVPIICIFMTHNQFDGFKIATKMIAAHVKKNFRAFPGLQEHNQQGTINNSRYLAAFSIFVAT